MASPQAYQSHGHRYYRIVESFRQDGKPRLRVVARLRETRGFVEVGDLDVALEVAHYLDGLVGETELLVAGGIVTLGVAVGQKVDGHQHRQDDEDVHTGVSRISGLSCLHPLLRHVTTSTGAIPP